jgi:hypothetical protein
MRGPGLVESALWLVFYHLAQLLAVALLAGIVVLLAFDGWPRDPGLFQQVVLQLTGSDAEGLLTAMTGAATLGALFVLVPAVFWRLRPLARRTLGLSFPTPRGLLLLSGAVLPLSIVSDELYRSGTVWMASLWEPLSTHAPWLKIWLQQDTVALIERQTASTAYPLLLVMVGVGPAIGEELVFRGLIGRGLTQRLGVGWGVLLTTLLFAFAHGGAAHAIATVPLGLFLHLAYLATGSLWAAILVHFLNNALSISMMKYDLAADLESSVPLVLSAIVYVAATAAMLWLRSDDRPVAGASLGERALTTGSGPRGDLAAPDWLTMLAGSGVVCFTGSFVLATLSTP